MSEGSTKSLKVLKFVRVFSGGTTVADDVWKAQDVKAASEIALLARGECEAHLARLERESE